MGIAQSTVENHIYLALRQLRAKLSKSELILLLFFIFYKIIPIRLGRFLPWIVY